MDFKIAIVGRPNVGKSTLFNRLVGKKIAIVHNSPGVTRDWKESPADLFGYRFTAIDTAGLESKKGNTLSQRMSEQSLRAVDLASMIFFVLDSRAGMTAEDRSIAKQLRKYDKPILVLVNKCEGKTDFSSIMDSFDLGFDAVIPISAEHGDGMGEIADYLKDYIKNDRDDDGAEEWEKSTDHGKPAAAVIKPMKIAIVGKPNAGKSTLVNQLIGEERLLTGPEAGITRDAITVPWSWKGHAMELVDTAGLRKKSRVTEKLETMATSETIHTLNMAEVVVVVLDITQGITHQDLTIAELAEREGRAVVIVVNKWDLIRDKGETRNSVYAIVKKCLPQIKDVPTVFISALHGNDLDKILKAIVDIHKLWNRRIPTAKFNAWLRRAVDAYAPPMVKGRRLKLRYGTQIKTRPPTFAMFVNNKYDMPDSYQRYLVNQLREEFDMAGVPIRFFLRQGENPYDSND